MNPEKVIKAAVPTASPEFCDYVLWSRTPFPAAFTARTLYKAAARAQRAHKNNIQLCDFCDNKVGTSVFCCTRCARNLRQARTQH